MLKNQIGFRRLSFRKFQVTSLIILFVCFWLAVIVFSLLAEDVLEREPIALDSWILLTVRGLATPFFDSLVVFITNLGSAEVIVPFTVLAGAYLIFRRHSKKAALLLAGVGGAAFANAVLKLLFQRQRPGLWETIVSEHSYSFPSGHAMASSALALCIVLLARHTKWRWTAVIAGATYVLAVGFSRVYLGVHYPSDIVAGWAVSAVWVLLVSSVILNYPFTLRSKLHRILNRKKTEAGPQSGSVE